MKESRQDWKERREREKGGQQGRNPSHLHPISVSLNTHHSTLNSFMPITLGRGSKDSFTIRGWQLWLKHCISTLYALYFRSVFIVSSCVLKEFIRTRGTWQPYLTFNRCRVQCKKRKNKCYMMPKRKSVSVMYEAFSSIIFLYWGEALRDEPNNNCKGHNVSCYLELKRISLTHLNLLYIHVQEGHITT